MRNAYRVLIAAAAAATMAIAAGAGAQGYGQCGNGPGNGPGTGPGMACTGAGPGGHGAGWGAGRGAGWQGGPAANAEARLAYLKDELKLNTSQAAAWTAYEGAVKTQAASMQARRDSMSATQTAADRMALMSAFAKQRANDLDVLNTAVQALYAALTPEQKAIVDANSRGRMFAMQQRGFAHGR